MYSPLYRSTNHVRRAALLALCSVLAATMLLFQRAQAQEPQGEQAPAPAQESVTVLAAGDIAKCNLEWDSYTGALLDTLPGTILGLGDNAYVSGTLQEFTDCYGPTWGRHKDRVYPVPGNHEYLTGGAEGYFTYFGDRATPLEPGCRKECKGYYSFDLGAWHIVALNSEINNDPGSEQDLWLRADLAAHPNVCTLAFWHKPRWSSGRHGSGASAPLFQAVYDYGVDIVLSGHDHNYERFAPQSPQGVLEYERGVRQFVVGTGGDTLRGWKSDAPNSEVRDQDTWGVLKLTLHPTSYDWEFIPIAGQTFTDKGSAPCVTAGSVPPPPPGAPQLVATGSQPVEVAGDSAANTTAAGTEPSAGAATALPAEGLDYVVQAGDTLSLIALRYGLDWQVVAQVNGITNTEVIEIGQVIRLPGVAETSATASVATAATAAATGAGPAAASPAAASTTGAAGGTTYTVVAGDTLFGIALRANVTLAALAAANNMQEDDLLLIGQQLVIPGRAAPLPSLTTLTPATSARRTVTTTTPAATTPVTTPVTGTRPVTATGVTAATPVTGTGATGSPATSLLPAPTPRPGAAGGAGTASAAATGPSVHTVAEGETIITIALAYNLDWQELLALNGLQPDSLIRVGQEIRLR
jgi:LysM repeat protein